MAKPYFTREAHFTNTEGIYFVEKSTCAKQVLFSGGDGGIRTLDLTDANRTLSQLSYAPVCLLVSFKHYITNFPFVKKNIDYIENL